LLVERHASVTLGTAGHASSTLAGHQRPLREATTVVCRYNLQLL
jgi:hypothetical protein